MVKYVILSSCDTRDRTGWIPLIRNLRMNLGRREKLVLASPKRATSHQHCVEVRACCWCAMIAGDHNYHNATQGSVLPLNLVDVRGSALRSGIVH